MSSSLRTKYPHSKYVALSLMVAKYLRLLGANTETFAYISLGGTEMFDSVLLSWIDPIMLSQIISFEEISTRYALAIQNEERLQAKGLRVEFRQDNIFAYRRQGTQRHVFFIDLEGVCKPNPFIEHFHEWFVSEVIQPGDFVLITSYSGRNQGWNKVLQPFGSEFKLLKVTSIDQQKDIYKIAHPLFVLYRALLSSGLEHEIQLNCTGYTRYFSNSTMGLYGIAIVEGQTHLKDLVQNVPVLDLINRDWSSLKLI
jgi:hypothetical protein